VNQLEVNRHSEEYVTPILRVEGQAKEETNMKQQQAKHVVCKNM
jgi:hypothetical protein